MKAEDISTLEDHFRNVLGIPVYLEAVAGDVRPRRPWSSLEDEVARFGSPERAAAWLRGRAAVERLLERLAAAPGSTVLPEPGTVQFPHPFLSLTHTRDRAIAAGTEPGLVLGIGVDLELRGGMREGAERFFLDAAELRHLMALPAASRGAERVRLWTIKEALYKAHPENAGTLLGRYRLEEPAAAAGRARLKADPAARSDALRRSSSPAARSAARAPTRSHARGNASTPRRELRAPAVHAPRFRYASVSLDPGALSVAVRERS